MLLGRESECARLDELLERARLGRSGALVILGEAGIGKTALLDHAADQAEGMTVVRTRGIESEAELEFSALLDACRPLLGYLGELPEPHAEALRSALDLGPAVTADRFAIGAATLGVLAAAAEADPLLVLVDDAHWLDPSSADALLFATRRLQADRVLVVFAIREGEGRRVETGGIETLALGGLSREQTTSLLERRIDVSPTVADRLYEATAGNPLALLEVTGLLSPEQAVGAAPLESPLPAGASVERAFARRAEALPEESQRALLVAAASASDALDPVAAALGSLGLATEALEPAEDAGLVTIAGERLEFRHPLVRSAIYQAASPSERRAVHRALADSLADGGNKALRAWHLAAAAVGPDEDVAAALEAVADRARERNAYAEAATALERAAALTPEPTLAVERLAQAAEAAWAAGSPEQARALAAAGLDTTDDAEVRARLRMLEGRLEFEGGTQARARELVLDAATVFERADATKAVMALDLAAWTLQNEGNADAALDLARRARALTPEDGGAVDVHVRYVLGRSLVVAGRIAEGEPLLEDAVSVWLEGDAPSRVDLVRAATSLGYLERLPECVEIVGRVTALARGEGPTALVYALGQSGHLRGRAGDWRRAVADSEEAVDLAGTLGLPNMRADGLGNVARIEARRGDERSFRAHADEVRAVLGVAGVTLATLKLRWAEGVLELGLGRHEDAVVTLGRLVDETEAAGITERDLVPVPDLAEALVRLGRADEAAARLDAWAVDPVGGPAWARALVLRCRGLLAADDDFDDPFLEAVELHGTNGDPFERGRTLLLHGERLRRAGRRRDARDRLREALDVFDELEASPWADRAHTELRASGETLRRRESIDTEQLTPQELQIALQVAEGKTNKEVGAALFLSHKTVEFHLSRIYRKLDLNSRAELIRQFAAEGAPAGAGTPTGAAP